MTVITSSIPIDVPNKQTQHPLVALLQEHGLQRVTIIDDYYDQSNRQELSAHEAEDLWTSVEFDNEALAELSALGSTVSGPADLTGLLLTAFLANRAQAPKFNMRWQQSIAGQRHEEQSAQLNQIVGFLVEECNLAVSLFGKEVSVDDIARNGAQLLLLDWYLEEDGTTATEMAVHKAKEIHTQWPSGQTKPHIVLMSSKPDIRAHADDFRRASGLLAGMFHAIPKTELSDQFSLQMHLHLIAMSLQAGHRVQAFVDALRLQVKDVGNAFIDGISALTLSDYAYIQSLSLQADGQPLGDYLVWLFSSYFGHLLFERALRQRREDLNTLTFTTLPSQTVPSTQLAEMYLHALFDVDVGPAAVHPRAHSVQAVPLQNDIAVVPDMPTAMDAIDDQDLALNLGDIFVPVHEPSPELAHDNSGTVIQSPASANTPGAAGLEQTCQLPELLMVINAQCDLSFTPDGSRRIERGRSILLLPGTLQPVQEPIPDKHKDAPRTELYEDGGHSYRIFWNTAEVKTIPYGEFRRWHDGADLHNTGISTRHKRKARLRLPFALEVQRAFASDLTRVGMPVAPPIYQAVNIRLLHATDNQFDRVEILEKSEAAFLVLSRDGRKVAQRCVLTLPLVCRLRQMLNAQLSTLEAQLREGSANGYRQRQLQSQVDIWRRTVADYTVWADLLSPIDVPTGTKPKKLVEEYLQIVRNKNVGDECPTNKVVAVVSLQDLLE